MRADAQTEAAVRAVMNEFTEKYTKRDTEGLLALIAPDEDVVFYGSGPDEKRLGRDEIRAQAERDWSQSDEASIVYDWTSISAAGPVAWAVADLTFKAKVGGQDLSLPGRLTAVFENRNGKWLIVHSHLSLPASSQSEGESFPT